MTPDHIDWDKLRVFSAVAELRSMTAAAKRLGESTPTVSRKIDDLEKTLKCELLVRTTKGVELTEAGRLVVKRTHIINDQTNSIWNDVCGLDIEGSGRLRMAASDGVASHWLTRFLPGLQTKYPGIELEMKIQEGEADLLAGDADLTFSFAEPRHRDLLSIRLGVLHYMFFAAPDYLEKRGRPQSLFDLHGHSCLFHESYINQIDRWASRAVDLRKSLTYSLITNSGTVLREVCAQGGGIALLPSYVAQIDSRLEPLDMPEIAPIQFWLMYTQRMQRLSRGRNLIDWIRQQFDHETHPWFRETFVHPKNCMDNHPAEPGQDSRQAG